MPVVTMSTSKLEQISPEDTLPREGLRILCICPSFVPHRDSEAFCSAKFVQAITDSGTSVTVFTCPGYGPRDFDTSGLWRRVQEKVVEVSIPRRKSPWESLRMALRFKVRHFARWMNATIEEASRLHGNRGFDIVYSRSLPMFGHIAGYWCMKKLNLPWIANLNDPWDWHLFPSGEAIR